MKKVKMKFKKVMAFAFLAMAGIQGAFAQGVEGLTEANTLLRSYIPQITNITMAIGVLIGLIGAIQVYMAWNSGDQNTTKKAVGWFGSCIFLVLSSVIVNSFFGIATP